MKNFCLSVLAALGLLGGPSAARAAVYETVNGTAQLSTEGADWFFVYWGVWRGFTPRDEEKIAASGGAALISNRRIRWRTETCQDSAVVSEDGENLWYLDRLELDDEGRVKPIPEAARPGFRYFSMLNLNGLKLAGRKATSLSRLRGQVWLEAEHFFLPSQGAIQSSVFRPIQDWARSEARADVDFMAKTGPTRWPVFYDERAHKPHSLAAPADFSKEKAESPDRFAMHLVWNACDGEGIDVEAFVPGGALPPAGPNRPGRTDRGKSELKIRDGR